jgi:imidazolonepropionase-like amidohydrolase
MANRLEWVAFLFFVVSNSCAQRAVPTSGAPRSSEATAFVGVNVVPGDGDRVIENQTVIVRSRRIAEIGPASAVNVPTSATRIEGKGKFLMPGIAEMHGHLPETNGPEASTQLALFVANGVTTVRGMRGAPNQLELRERIDRGELVGPRLVVYGPVFDGNNTRTPELGQQRVEEHKKAGYDGIKIFEGLRPATFDAVARAAKQLGIPFGGHVPNDVGLEKALLAGQASIDHLDGYVEALERDDTSRDASKVRTPVGVNSAVLLEQIDENKINDLVSATRKAGAVVVPTMGVWRTFFGDAKVDTLRLLPELKYVPAADVDEWIEEKTEIDRRGPPAAHLANVMRLRDQVLKALASAGGTIVLGSDAPQLFSVPGFSLRREMEAMVKAGMTPWQVIEAATIAPARFLGLAKEVGTAEVGKRADLILADGNPLDNVANVFRSSGVMVNGRWLPRAELDNMLAEVERTARAAPRELPISAEEAKAVAGTYSLAGVDVTLVVAIEDGTLVLVARDPKGTKKFRMRPKGGGAYAIREVKGTLTFEIREGRATGVTFSQGGTELKGTRTAEVTID